MRNRFVILGAVSSAIAVIFSFSLTGCSSGGGYLTPFTPLQATSSQTTSAYTPPATVVGTSTPTSQQATPPVSTVPLAATNTIISTTQPPQTSNKPLQMSNVAWEVTQVDSINYWHIAWKFSLNNPNSQPYKFDATIQYIDANGFQVEVDYAWSLIIAGSSTTDFTGSDTMASDVGPKVTKVVVSIGSTSLYVAPVNAQLSNIGWAVTQVDSINYWHIAWKFTVNNPNNQAYKFDAEIQFLDAKGFEIDIDYDWSLTVAANSSNDFTGSDIAAPTVGPNVTKIVVTLS